MAENDKGRIKRNSLVLKVGLAAGFVILFFKSIVYGGGLLLKLCWLAITTYFVKKRALDIFQKELLKMEIPEKIIRELKKSYDVKLTDIIRR